MHGFQHNATLRKEVRIWRPSSACRRALKQYMILVAKGAHITMQAKAGSHYSGWLPATFPKGNGAPNLPCKTPTDVQSSDSADFCVANDLGQEAGGIAEALCDRWHP